MKIIAIRHGETEGNVKRIVQSRTHGVLTQKGIEQAILAGKKLALEKFDAVYCSDLGRCVQTAEKLLSEQTETPLSVIYTKELRERNQGDYEGGSWDDLPWLDHEGEYLDNPITNGESWVNVYERIGKFLNILYSEYPDATFLLVTHGGPVKALRSLLSGISLRQSVDEPIQNADIFRAEMNGLIQLNEEDMR